MFDIVVTVLSGYGGVAEEGRDYCLVHQRAIGRVIGFCSDRRGRGVGPPPSLYHGIPV